MYELELLIREFLQEDIILYFTNNSSLPIELKGKRLKEDKDWVFV